MLLTFVLLISFGCACISLGHARTPGRETISIALVFATGLMLAIHEGWSF